MLGRPLTAVEVVAYDHLPTSLAGRVRVLEVAWLPGRYVGLTLGRWVLLADDVPDDGSSVLLAHELVHVAQWHELGAARFAADYLRSFATGFWRTRSWHESYRAIPAEAEARAVAGRWYRGRGGTGAVS